MPNNNISEIEIYHKLSRGEISKEKAMAMLAVNLDRNRESNQSHQAQAPQPPDAPSVHNAEAIRASLAALISESLHLSPDELRYDVSFQDLGIDSINGLEIIQAVNRTFGLSLDAVVLYDHATVDGLSEFVSSELDRSQGLFHSLLNGSVAEVEYQETAAAAPHEPQPQSKLKLKLFSLGSPSAQSPAAEPDIPWSPLEDQIEAESVMNRIVRMVSENLHLAEEEVHHHTSFSDLGVDSINGLEIIRDVNRSFGLNLDAVVLYDYGTVASLAACVQEELRKHDTVLAAARPVEARPVEARPVEARPVEARPVEVRPVEPAPISLRPLQQLKPTELSAPQEEQAGTGLAEPYDIAVIGISGRFPGAENTEDFWHNLITGTDSVTEIPGERWDAGQIFDPVTSTPNKSYSRAGGFLTKVDRFDTLFFNIPPVEALSMDPQQRIFLEEAWKALEDAGCSDTALSNSRCGVFVGAAQGDYMKRLDTVHQSVTAEAFTGMAPSMFAARISYFLNLTGPSVTIDTACSSSLVALHLACQSIRNQDSDMAIVGGVRLNLTPDLHIMTSKVEMLSPTGKCRAFDQSADGTILSEGVGAIVLQPLHKAIAGKHSIYGVIKGSSINQDGKTNGITAPSSQSQFRLESDVYTKAGINPDRISYVEAHGTGTKLGDPIEVKALTRAFRAHTERKQYCAIGSVKTNIGHTTTASGVISMIKVLLAMKHRKIPATINYEVPNEHIPFPETPFYVNTETLDWKPQNGSARLAAVSSFGFSGTNAHVVVEEYPQREAQASSQPYYLITLSAKSGDALKCKIKDMRTWLEQHSSSCSIADIAYTLNMGRSHFPLRAALVVSGVEELQARLQEIAFEGTARDYVVNQSHARAAAVDLKTREDIQDTIDSLHRGAAAGSQAYKENLLALADYYVKGQVSHCERIFTEEGLKLIQLPAYPFMGERYWIEEEPGAATRRAEAAGAGLHPMLDRNVSTLNEQRFEKIFTGQEFFLADHLVGADMILPAVAYLEMAKTTGDLAHPQKKVARLSENYWSNAIKVTADAKKVSLSLIPFHDDPDTVAYEVLSMEDNERIVVHGRGKIKYEALVERGAGEDRVNLDEIRKRCSRRITGEQCYRMFETEGLNLGRSYQSIQELLFNEDEVLAHIQLPEHLQESFSSYSLHPSLMDGALEAVIGMLSVKVKSGGVRLPFYIGDVELYGELVEDGYSYARCTGSKRIGLQETECFDVFMLDRQGQILVKIKDFSLWELGKADRSKDGQTGLADSVMYYRPEWTRRDWILPDAGYVHMEPWLMIFDTSSELREVLDRKLYPAKTILVKPGEVYREETAERTFVIRPDEGGDYIRLLEALRQQGRLPRQIAYLWSKETEPEMYAVSEARLNASFYSVMHLAQALERSGYQDVLRLNYMFRTDQMSFSPLSAAFGGFARSLRLENGKYLFKSLRVDIKSSLDETADGLLAEFHPSQDQEIEVAYKNGLRWVKGLTEHEPAGSSPLRIAPGGVYVITGGTGGLGFLFARYLASEYKARLCLSGRRPLNGQQQAQIRELEALGSEVIFVQADISDSGQAERLIRTVKESFGKINGIIHGAGINKDAYLRDQTKESMEQVLAPKIAGTLHLERLTRQDDLDFFVLFSSTSAVTGNLGQTGYAYANSFMDHFAELRHAWVESGQRTGKTLSLNWPLWKAGGMQVGEETKTLFKSLGISSLETENGIQALLDGLASADHQLIIFQGQPQKLRTMLQLDRVPKPASAEVQDGRKADFSDRIRKSMIQVVGDILRIKEKDIHVEKNMDEYGFNSLTFTDFANRINAIYRTDINPSLFFEHPTLQSLIAYMHEHHYESVQALYQPQAIGEEQTEASFAVGAPQPMWEHKETLRRPGLRQESPAVDMHGTMKAAETGTSRAREDIAIIGMSGVMPQSEDLASFWESLEQKKDLVTEVPAERWDRDELPPAISRWGGFMQEINCFDPLFFGISPMEAELMDPQQRIFLQTVWETIADSGYKPSDLSGTHTGLFVGVSTTDYRDVLKDVEIEALTSTGNSHCILANRISYLLNIHGPSEPIDTACSSSLVAIHRGVESIHSGDCEMAIVGGVNVIASPTLHISFSKAGMLSPDGRCRTFDETANGYVRGEGSGALLLKPLSKALEAGDHVYAVIKGTAINHGGHAASLTAPNPNAQADLIVKAMQKADIDPDTVSYIEAHGTGTKLGDPVEMNGLLKAFKELNKRKGTVSGKTAYCGVGSVKTNIGHLETAAGIASVLKVLLAMKHQTLPGTPHLKAQNSFIQLSESPFYIVKDTQEWKAQVDEYGTEIPRRAGVSSFGFGGVNAHVVLEEYPHAEQREAEKDNESEPQIILLSARNKERLQVYADKWHRFLKTSGKDRFVHGLRLADVAYTLQAGRQEMDERVAFIVRDFAELEDKLLGYIEGRTHQDQIYQGNVKANKDRPDFLTGSISGSEIAQILTRNKDWGQLASLWVSGVQVDWVQLHAPYRPKRVSLPAYPFEKRRVWIGKMPEASVVKPIHQNVEQASFIHDHFYKSSWKPLPEKPRDLDWIAGDAGGKQVLVLVPDAYAGLADELSRRHHKDDVMLVKLGSRNKRYDQNHWEIDVEDEKALPACLAEITALDTIYFLGGLTSKTTIYTDVSSVSQAQEQGAVALFRLIKVLAARGFDNRRLAFKVWTNNVHAVHDGERNIPCAGSILGLVKTMAKEFGFWEISCADVDLAELEKDPALLSMLLNEPASRTGDETVIRRGTRYVRHIAPVLVRRDSAVPFKKGGVYLIIGGAGGIGLEFSSYLSRTVQANIALIGRSEASDSVQEKLREVEALGGKVLYVRADATDPAGMREAVRQIKEQFGSINGVVHSAIVMKDRSLRNMTEAELRDALAPKVQGSVVMYDALKDEKLDFMMFFSSIQTFVGNPGQGNYAAACAFKDAFAAHLSHLGSFPVKIINWGYWGTVGVASSKAHNQRSAAAGLYSISPEEGMEAIRSIVSLGDLNHTIVLKADKAALIQAGIETEPDSVSLPESKSLPKPESSDQARLPQGAEASNDSGLNEPQPLRPIIRGAAAGHKEELKSLVEERVALSLAQVLKVNTDEVDFDIPFSDYGVDSITGLALIQNMNEAFELELKSTLLFDYSNIHDFSAYLCKEHGWKISQQLSGEWKDVAADEAEHGETEVGLLEQLAQGELTVDEVLKMIG